MKKILALILAIMFLALPLSCGGFLTSASSFNLQTGKEAQIISSKCDLYLQPSFASEKLKDGETVVSFKHGSIVLVKELSEDFALIEKDEIEGWAYKYYLTQNTSQDVYPVFNGKIRNNTSIYDIEMKDTGLIAKKDTRIFIYSGFNEKKQYTPVQLVLEDGSLYNGYIKTADIKPDGISSLLIIGISIIAAAVTIILSLVFIQKKNKKKKGLFRKKKNST